MQRTDRKFLWVEPLQAATLLVNMYKAAKHPEIGWQDADNSLRHITKYIESKHKYRIPTWAMESALWACNMLHEERKFWDATPNKAKFDIFLEKIDLPSDVVFDKETNLLLRRPRK